jgi:hypothetical protein
MASSTQNQVNLRMHCLEFALRINRIGEEKAILNTAEQIYQWVKEKGK